MTSSNKAPAFSLFGHEQAIGEDPSSIRWGDEADRLGTNLQRSADGLLRTG